ncbi:Membrane transporter of cations and cationic drugs [Thermoplasmatales archaeon BRNA1]|nr:Membrane transporter of cations and cationic drugs [Thermoplasmatales archaeon BRNA1]
MYDPVAICWLIAAGIIEPIWVIALTKSDSFRVKSWATVAAVGIMLSPVVMSMSLRDIPVGVAYAMWTGMGSIFTVCASAILFKDRITPRMAFYISLIIVGAIAISLAGDPA